MGVHQYRARQRLDAMDSPRRAATALRPLFDLVWQSAAGLPRSFNYNEPGN